MPLTAALTRSMNAHLILCAGRALLASALLLSPLAALAGDSDLFPGFTAVAPPPAPRPVPLPAATAPDASSRTAEAAAAVPAAGNVAPSAPNTQDPLNQLLDRLPATTPPDAPLAEPAVVPAPQDLWQRVRAGFRIPDLDTKLADQRTRWYAEQVEYFARMVARTRPQPFADLAPGRLEAVLEFARRTDRIRVISERQDRDIGWQNEPGCARGIQEHRPVAAAVGDITGRDDGKCW